MAVTARRLRRLEAWSDWQAAGGTRQAIIADAISVVASTAVDNDQLVVTLPLDSTSIASLGARKILRVDQDDATFDEYRIFERTVDHERGVWAITAAPLRLTDLQGAGLISRKDSDGVVVYDFEVLGLTASEIITNWVLPALAAAGFGWITLGTVTPTARLDMTFAWDTPLAVLLRLQSATQSELDVRRNGTGGYLLDVVTKVNASAQQADLRVDKNLINVVRSENSIDQATRVFPKGAADDEMAATMARAKWAVQSTAGPIITLKDPAGGKGPIQFDNQLVGAYFREPDGTMRQVLSSSAANQTVTLASSPTVLTIDDLVEFRADVAGADLTYLEDPASLAVYGVKAAVREVGDVPSTNNLVKNPAMRTWPGGAGSLPSKWTAVGTPTIAKQTVAPFTAIGGQSIKVTSTLDGQGVISEAVPIFPTALAPYLAGYAKLWVASGHARVELVINTPSGVKVFPTLPDVATPSTLGQWFDVGASGFDANGVAATTAQIRIVQNGTAASVFYVDAAQITQSASQQPWFEGSGGTRLWQEANEALRTGSTPVVSLTVPLVDLETYDPITWSESALIIGANARIVDPQLALDVVTRIVGIERDYVNPQSTSVTLSNKYDDLTDLLAARLRPDRTTPNPGTTEQTTSPPGSVERPMAVVDFDSAGHAQINLIGGAGTISMKLEVSSTGAPSDGAIEATTPIEGSAALISYSTPIIPPGGTLYLGAYAYSAASGGGTRSLRLDVTARRQGAGAATPPRAELALQAESQTSITYRLTGTLGAGGTSPLQYRFRYDTNGVAGTWSAWAALGAFVDLVRAKNKFYQQELFAQTRDSSATPVESDYAIAPIMGQFEPIDPSGGRILHAVPMDAGFTPFQYGGDTADGVNYSPTTGRAFVHYDQTDQTIGGGRVVAIKRTGVNTEPTDNLFKRGSDTATDVVTTSARTFVDPNAATQVDGSGHIVGVWRFGAIEPVNNLVKFGDTLTDSMLSSNMARLNATQSWTNLQSFNSGATWTTAGWNRSARFPAGTMLEFGDASNPRMYGFGNSLGILYGMTAAGEASTDTAAYWMIVNNLAVNHPGTLTVGAYAGSAISVGDIAARRSATTGVLYFGDAYAYIYFDGTAYQMPAGLINGVGYEFVVGNAGGNYIDGQVGSFGSFRAVGSYAGWAGIDFISAGSTLMMGTPQADYWGIWNASIADWKWQFDNAQTAGATSSIGHRQNYLGVRSLGVFAQGGIVLSNSALATKGYVFWDSTGFGLLDSGGNWRTRVTTSGGTLFGAWQTTGDHTVSGRLFQQGEGTVTRRVASIIVSSSAPTSGDSAPDGTLWLQT